LPRFLRIAETGRSTISKHVLMTPPNQEDFDALHERALRFIGAFTSANFTIDGVVGAYLQRRMPDLAAELAKQVLYRISDEQRMDLFQAFAVQADYKGDLTHFGTIYKRAKALRDMVGHSLNVIGPVYSVGKPPSVAIANTLSPQKRRLVPEPLLPSTFTRMTADCEWITQHILRAGYTAEPEIFKDLTGEPYEPPAPAALPVGGEPLA
jgi:hypothetical protein